MSTINKPLDDDILYELPARVVGKSQAGSVFVRLFLDSSIEIDSDISFDKPKNIFLKQAKNQDINERDLVLVRAKGWIANQYILNGEISENNKTDRLASFIKKLTETEYKNYLKKCDNVINFDKLVELQNKKHNLEQSNNNLEQKKQDIERELLQKSNDFNQILENIEILKSIQDLEQANGHLERLLKENKWIDEIKPYFVDSKPSSTLDDNYEIITKTKSKPLFNGITNTLIDRFNLSENFIHCYLLSLFTSLTQGRFLLLTGHIGTGKSSIIKETGALLGGQTNMVAVRPAWLDASDLLGYFDPINNRYHTTDFVQFLRKKDDNHINMILLDELNIARIENYGADILACLSEIGIRNLEQNKIRLFNQDLQEIIDVYQMYHELLPEKQQKYQNIIDRINGISSISIPNNVLICGTLNIDGSTENLSPKMIDRSFMLKFPDFNGLLNDTTDIQDKYPLFISQMINSLKGRKKIDCKYWNEFYGKYINNIKNVLIPISNRVAKDYLWFYQFAEFFGVDDRDKVDGLFFYARILPRLRAQRLSESDKITLIEILSSFSQQDIFETFISEIQRTRVDEFIDYQYICG